MGTALLYADEPVGVLKSIGNVVSAMVGWVGNVITELFGTNGSWSTAGEFLFIGVGITILLTAVGIVRSFIYGRG